MQIVRKIKRNQVRTEKIKMKPKIPAKKIPALGPYGTGNIGWESSML